MIARKAIFYECEIFSRSMCKQAMYATCCIDTKDHSSHVKKTVRYQDESHFKEIEEYN